MGMFTLKGVIACILVAVIGFAVSSVHAFQEPEDIT